MVYTVVETVIEKNDCFGEFMYRYRHRFNGKGKARKYLESFGYKEEKVNIFKKFECEEHPYEGDIWYEYTAKII